MQANELITSPGSLLALAAALGVAGGIVFGLAHLIMKAFGDDIYRHARDSERYKYLGTLDQLHTFYSDFRNIPLLIGFFGLFAIFCGVLMTIGALLWFIVRSFSGG